MTFEDFITHLLIELPDTYLLTKVPDAYASDAYPNGKTIYIYDSAEKKHGVALTLTKPLLDNLEMPVVSTVSGIITEAFERAMAEAL